MDSEQELRNEEIAKLRKENIVLRRLLGMSVDEEILVIKPELIVTNRSSTQDKIRVYRSLFKGREDLFAQRWESTLKSGYSPVCLNRWDKTKCNLPKIKCNICSNRELKAIDDNVIYDHLAGKITIGIYPILRNDNCNFLAIDFDKKRWKEDVTAIYTTCLNLNIPTSIEISRSGNGAHLWIFFSEEISAIEARKLGNHIISETMKMGQFLDLDSYDRMFPNQDYLPEGGFGNLIALPLQKKVRKYDFSVFVSANFKAFPDQWAYLSSIKKLSLSELQHIIKNKTVQIPETIINKSTKVRITLSNQIFISKHGLPKHISYKLLQLAVFPNPEFYIAQASRRSTFKIPRFINCSENFPEVISIPTGLLNKVIEIFNDEKIKYTLADQRNLGIPLDCSFIGKLREKQEEAFTEILKHDMSILCASTGFGKTILAIKLITERKVNTLILVHRKELLVQWKEKISIYTRETDIGTFGTSKAKQTLQIDVAMIQTLKNLSMERIDQYGQIIIDECHHIAAYTFENILKKSRAKFILGMTATPIRKDGHHPIVFMQCGEIKYRTNAKLIFDSMQVFKRELNTNLNEENVSLASVISTLSQDQQRNSIICKNISEVFRRGRKILVLTERVSHLKLLQEELSANCHDIVVLKGNMKKMEKEVVKRELKELNQSDSFIIIATGRYVGEGFDFPLLDTLFLTLPISWKGTLQQYVGRIVRSHESKTSLEVYDFVDIKQERLTKMYDKRRRAYKSLGFEIINYECVILY